MPLQTLVEQLPQEDPDYDVDLGCLLYKEGEYEEACKKFTSSMNVLGYQPGERFITGLRACGLQQNKTDKHTHWCSLVIISPVVRNFTMTRPHYLKVVI